MFPMNPETTRSMTRQYEQEMQCLAETERVARLLRRERFSYSPLMVNVGKHLVAWGTRLQGRYNRAAEALTNWQEATNESIPRATSEIALARK